MGGSGTFDSNTFIWFTLCLQLHKYSLRPKWCCQALGRFCPAQGLPTVTLIHSLPLKDPVHIILSSIWLFIHQSLPLTTNLSEPSSKWIYQRCRYLRGKGVPFQEFVKTVIWKKKRSPAYCTYAGQANGAHLLYIPYRVFQTLSKQVSVQPALYTSPSSCFLCVRIYLSSALPLLLPYVVPAALLYCSPSSPLHSYVAFYAIKLQASFSHRGRQMVH